MEIDNETNGDLENSKQWKKRPTRLTSVNIDAGLHDQAKKSHIGLKDALEFGIKFLIADQDGFDYPDCKLTEKLQKIIDHRNRLLAEIETLKDPIIEDPETAINHAKEVKKEFDDVFGGIKNE